ncbi:hypothetical protein [Leptolyngbya sp. PCC 6406]|uniref:hypothetical protein n=1 Tax=Leptolyngbya sp. PCC 6406 TaxID=1173264 RepID=UPI0002ACBF2E|nr:hypothetical protein [Leptolyngbya sp. PCC 6406]
MIASTSKRGVGIFHDYQVTEQALRELFDTGYGMDRVSVMGQDTEHLNASGQAGTAQVQDLHTDENHADDGAKTGVAAGATVGGLTGLLVGLGTLAIPGVGPIMLAGAAATAIATTVTGGAIGAATGGLVGSLIGMGIPEDRAKVYNEKLSQGKYLIIVDGTDSDIARAEPILKRRGIHEWNVYPFEGQSTMTDMNAPRPNRVNPTGTATPSRF